MAQNGKSAFLFILFEFVFYLPIGTLATLIFYVYLP